jgi:hypothetical protein
MIGDGNLSLRGRGATTGQPSCSCSAPRVDQSARPGTIIGHGIIIGARYAACVHPGSISVGLHEVAIGGMRL